MFVNIPKEFNTPELQDAYEAIKNCKQIELIVKEISKLIEIKHEYGKFHIIPKRDLNENQIIYIDNKEGNILWMI